MILACSHIGNRITCEEIFDGKLYEIRTPLGPSIYCRTCVVENKLIEDLPDTYFEYEPLKEALHPICAACFEEFAGNENTQVIGEIEELG